MSTFNTPSRKILFDPPKNTPKWGKSQGKARENTPSENLRLAGLH
jgi:hypothetical protein